MLINTIKNFSSILLKLPKKQIVFSSDLCFTLLALWMAYSIKSDDLFQKLFLNRADLSLLFIVLTIQAVSYWVFGLYRGVWRFASIPDLIRIIKACVFSGIVLLLLTLYLKNSLFTHSILSLFCLFSICILSSTRLTYRWYKDQSKLSKNDKKVLVIGAGYAGELIIRELKRTNQELFPIGFIDDDPAKLGLEIHGIRVLGNTNQLIDIALYYDIELILIAIPTANPAQMRRVVDECEKTGIPYRTLPNLSDIVSGKETITNIRQVCVEDLLSREPIQFNHSKIDKYIAHKTILVTGAGGSIGSELCRKIAECRPKNLILIEHSEFNLFQLQSELENKFPNLQLHSHLVSITNKEMIEQIMHDYKPDYVFHAAAYKHVPLLEPQIKVAIENNIFGTQIVANAAYENNVKKFILVSTDKAVAPNNVMGATKRCAELICQCLNKNKHATNYITVRFGNVLGSTGSVVPLFKQQIAQGGPVTITHPDMERYFMTIQEAAQLIIETITMEEPSDLYILDMGEPVKITYLAEQMIKLSGYRPNVDISITYSGLRPGEKINEELFYDHETVSQTDHSKILRASVPAINAENYMQHLQRLKKAYLINDPDLRNYLFDLASAENLHDLMPKKEFIPAMKKASSTFAMEFSS